jgi:putative hemolysin
MKTKTLGLVALLAIGALTLVGCNKNSSVENPDENAEIANPASVYCEENGGTLQIEE